MRGFIVFCLVIGACSADKLGYNYRPVAHSNTGLSFLPGDSSSTNNYNQQLVGTLNNGLGDGLSSSFVNSGPSVDYVPPAQAELNKEFFTYSAPEADFEDDHVAQKVANSLKKNLRVIFIKGPENKALENAALSLAKHASEDRTAIYVLNKQTDINELANKLNIIRNDNNAKPEVHFVKYRTPEDATNAQRAIQSQYDNLGGPSSSHDGGVANVLNFASQAKVQGLNSKRPDNAYLPANVFRLRV